MAAPQFYFDTYALIERARGTKSYEAYGAIPIFCHESNVFEFIAHLLRDHSETVARRTLRETAINPIEAETEDLFSAARFRAKHRGVSYVDALGYTLARKHGMRFLTGDKAFKGIEGVEHVA